MKQYMENGPYFRDFSMISVTRPIWIFRMTPSSAIPDAFSELNLSTLTSWPIRVSGKGCYTLPAICYMVDLFLVLIRPASL